MYFLFKRRLNEEPQDSNARIQSQVIYLSGNRHPQPAFLGSLNMAFLDNRLQTSPSIPASFSIFPNRIPLTHSIMLLY